MAEFEIVLIGAGALLLISVIAGKATGRFGIPAVLLFLIIGMLAGSEGPGGIYFDNAAVAQAVGILALAFIMFSGGLDLEVRHAWPVVPTALALATVGVLLSTLLVGAFATIVLHFTLLQGLLLGAVISSTDAAAVFSVLQAGATSLPARLKYIVEVESGSNDPMAIFLTLGLIELLQMPDRSALSLVPMFVIQMGLGALFGLAFGFATAWVLAHLQLRNEGIYPVLSVAVVLLCYGVTAWAGGSGFLAVYVAGIVIGNRRNECTRAVVQFHDTLAWLMQISMFLVLGLLVFPSRLFAIAGTGLLLSAFLMFLARPVSVFLALTFSRLHLNDKLLVSWLGLRGAAPIVLATFPLLADLPRADEIFNLVFFIALTSVLLQGASLPFAIVRLGRAAPPAESS